MIALSLSADQSVDNLWHKEFSIIKVLITVLAQNFYVAVESNTQWIADPLLLEDL